MASYLSLDDGLAVLEQYKHAHPDGPPPTRISFAREGVDSDEEEDDEFMNLSRATVIPRGSLSADDSPQPQGSRGHTKVNVWCVCCVCCVCCVLCGIRFLAQHDQSITPILLYRPHPHTSTLTHPTRLCPPPSVPVTHRGPDRGAVHIRQPPKPPPPATRATRHEQRVTGGTSHTAGRIAGRDAKPLKFIICPSVRRIKCR